MLTVRFFGVRGSTPCSGEAVARYGGNTSSVVVEHPDEAPVLFDLGTGLRPYGVCHGHRPFVGSAFVTHLHWDHVQGLPFFGPLVHCNANLSVFGPRMEGSSMGDGFRGLMRPPFFPIEVDQLPGTVEFVDVVNDSVSVGTARVTARSVPHVGETNGYRIDWGGRSIAYISDHQEPVHDPTFVDERVLELADGVDVLIHDAQFTPEEFRQRATWGHCTISYALEVARQARVEHLVLFHHDPSHDDTCMDRLLADARDLGRRRGIPRISAAAEGDALVLR